MLEKDAETKEAHCGKVHDSNVEIRSSNSSYIEHHRYKGEFACENHDRHTIKFHKNICSISS